mmetsp:Transcript_54500/g.157600  ORF Transcript_54500/g.157600 Transcript_54500/m.157600 type:complete len:207 (-) Transcript_54500:36-656(-)|eukprot:CAMPEP_0176132746 /NCGR_PEP_ID=MMETSP0120_2-20121206/67259_1 /TAXON_ID=160619 /ORGANISM="Kryptoperidinium foliaceum, Strain CCMP 1326" /LENGTH=206 /DNA_ID=CAMNT_0017468251 /DNA_START=78 /DNA_END=698 /DNA_ORIENTATION=-
MSTSSRAYRAVSSRQLKQQVVKLIFGPQYAKKGPEAHRLLDASIYSYADLKKAYLSRIQEIHPDKIKKGSLEAESMTRSFQELQEAWSKYEELAKLMKSPGNGNEEANFTMFGVGCSFSDSEEERALREEFTEQACRGWLSSGMLAERSVTTSTVAATKSTSLVDDGLFTNIAENSGEDEADSLTKGDAKTTKGVKKRRTLIPGIG